MLFRSRAQIVVNLSEGKERFLVTSRKITCHQVHLISKAFGIEIKEIGKILDDQGIKIAHCQLGLF